MLKNVYFPQMFLSLSIIGTNKRLVASRGDLTVLFFKGPSVIID